MNTTNLIAGTGIEPGAASNCYIEFARAALADGYRQCRGGVWGDQQQPYARCPDTRKGLTTGGRHEGDHTIALYKDDIVIYLVDRTLSNGCINRWTLGWFAHGNLTMGAVPEHYDAEIIESARRFCTMCKQSGDPARLKQFRFGERLCPDCDTPEVRAAGEFPGWYN